MKTIENGAFDFIPQIKCAYLFLEHNTDRKSFIMLLLIWQNHTISNDISDVSNTSQIFIEFT